MMNSAKSRVTLKDIAQECGYSVNTVSRALRGDSRLPEETIRRIRESAYTIGYIRNNLASSLRSGKSNVIAIIIEDLQNQHYSYLLDMLSLYLSRNGYRVMILTSRNDLDPNARADDGLSASVDYAIAHAVDGVLFFPNRDSFASAKTLQKNNIPLVLIDREIDGVESDIVRLDDYEGGRIAARQLLEQGHRRLVYMAGPLENGSQYLREKGFFDVLKEQGISKDQVLILPHRVVMQSIEEHALDELLFPVEYTGVFAFNDQIAYYVLNCLRDNEINVPEDVSVIGFDNIRARYPYMMPLSSIGDEEETDMPGEAVRLLLERIEDPVRPVRSIILPVRYYDGGTLHREMPGFSMEEEKPQASPIS